MTDRSWELRGGCEAEARGLAAELGVSQILSRLLVRRGLGDPAAAHRFLNPSLLDLHDPFLLPGMAQAVERIAQALKLGESILVHGDYDVDGLTSAALLGRSLSALGAKVETRAPHRANNGYDLQPESVERAAEEGHRLIVTSDCGTSALEAAARARELGIDLVVTDHHQPGPEVVDALAVVNPHLPSSDYPFKDICAAAVTLKLVCALSQHLGHSATAALRAFLDLAALGTASDLMPLVDENRAIVRFGLEALQQTRKLGLLALMQTAGCHGRALNAWDLGFVLGPRLNAIGRMDDAQLGVELLLTKDEPRALALARKLEEANRRRKVEQARVFEEARAQAATRDLGACSVLVLSGQGWSSGVIGLVATRIAETFRRPTIVIAEENGVGRASCRSLAGFHLMRALDACRDLLIRCGGHQGAAGFDLKMANLAAFRDRINDLAADEALDWDAQAALAVDLVLPPDAITQQLQTELRLLEPFGVGNPEPLFASTLALLSCRRIGSDGSHLKLSFRGDGLSPTDAVYWRRGELYPNLSPGTDLEVCFRLRQNAYNGRESLQLEVEALRVPSEGNRLEPLAAPGGAGDPFTLAGSL
ncbi:MAG TPA: single-stranded-DNA-specific exonuclease RecJ [Armatimonadota bacterium]|jgi:single-stranded-DNA-specific exonuclease